MNHKPLVALSLLGIFSGAQIAEAASYPPPSAQNGCGSKQMPTAKDRRMKNNPRVNNDDQIHGCPSRNGRSNQNFQQGCNSKSNNNYNREQNSNRSPQNQENNYVEADYYRTPSNQNRQTNNYDYSGCGGQNSCGGR